MLSAEPLYTVENHGEWQMKVFKDYTFNIDYYEGFAEIVLWQTK
jgi:hypothetical protein